MIEEIVEEMKERDREERRTGMKGKKQKEKKKFPSTLTCYKGSKACQTASQYQLDAPGPVVQSVVSLTSSLRVISLTVLVDSIYNILIFFAEKM